MKTIQTRFGEIEFDPKNVIHFPDGLIGLEHLKNFLVMPNEKEGPLFWIQCVDDTDFAFVLTDPTNFYYDYAITPNEEEMEKLQITKNSKYFTLVIVTVTKERKITLNLSGPIIYSDETRRALQVVIEDAKYSPQTPLPEIPTEKK